MKLYCSIIFLLISCSCFRNKASEQTLDVSVKDTVTESEVKDIPNIDQETSDISESKKLKSFVLNDTTFLLRQDYGECGTHSVYIEKNRKSKYYKMLKDFSIREYEQSTYDSYMATLRKNIKGGLRTFDLDSLPQQWIPLHLFEGKYYLYAPSDWGDAGKRVIDNQTIISYYMDGPTPCAITDVDKRSNYYHFDYLAPYENKDQQKSLSLSIYIIDPKYKIAIWESKDNDDVSYRLMIPSKNAGYFDLINNHSPLCKATEIEIGEPDYKSLLTRFYKENNKQ